MSRRLGRWAPGLALSALLAALAPPGAVAAPIRPALVGAAEQPAAPLAVEPLRGGPLLAPGDAAARDGRLRAAEPAPAVPPPTTPRPRAEQPPGAPPVTRWTAPSTLGRPPPHPPAACSTFRPGS